MRRNSIFVLLCVLGLWLLAASNASAKAEDIVKGKKEYTYLMMERDLLALEKAYPELVTLHTIGTSEYGRELYALEIGKGSAALFINASHHAREFFTTAIVMNQIQDLLLRQAKESDLADLLEHVTIWVVPMVNPDGVSLVQKGLDAFPKEAHPSLLALNKGSENFKSWKANAKGIDLNRQYPADWKNIMNNASKASAMNYKGSKPLETKENQALLKLTYEINPQLAISNHSTGRIIFWNFHTPAQHVERDRKLATQLSSLTGYSLVRPVANPSGGGYTDWFIQTFGKPAFTPEMGPSNGGAPVPTKHFEEEWRRNRDVMVWAAKAAYELWLADQEQQFTEVERMIELTEPVKLYKQPNRTSYAYTSLNQESIRVKAQWDHWFLIDTWAGERYIYLPDEELPLVETTIELKEATAFYRFPNEGAPKVGEISPQRIVILKQTLNWAKVNTWLGEMWIQV
ncbi:M14 family zinc carboxypeptidase [Paenibacillus septentrionalis]|uniref:M14 family zinc carboxypeptidase n=2 Tax=Paenibacillus septentrionalis TaxID=429342 RepID=A0ABW1V816_9BACL